MCSYTTAIVSITACLGHAPKKMHAVRKLSVCIKSSSDFKVLSARKLKTRFQKYKLQLILRKYIYRELLKDTVIIPTRLLCQMQANSSGAEFLNFFLAFSRAVVQLTAKKCTKKRDAHAKLLFCLVKLLLI